MRQIDLVTILLIASSVFVASACAPVAGEYGELGFAYGSADQISHVSVRRALAKGCDAEIVVYDSDARQSRPDVVWGDRVIEEARPVDVQTARSSQPEVFEVVETDGPRVRLRGKSNGKARLHVQTAESKDVIDVRVATTHHVELDHLAWSSDRATPSSTVLLRDGTVHFSLERKTADGNVLACFEPEPAVEIEPSGIVDVVNEDRDMHHLRLAIGAAERVAITPRSGSGYSLATSASEEVSRVEINFVVSKGEPSPEVLDVDQSALFRVDVFTSEGRYALALEGPLEVASETPEICKTTSLARWTSDGLFAVRGLAPGACRLSANIGPTTATYELKISE